MKSKGNSKLGYGFKGSVESERTDLKVRTRRRRMIWNTLTLGPVYDIITMMMMMIVIKVGGDEIWVGDVRAPGFANAPES